MKCTAAHPDALTAVPAILPARNDDKVQSVTSKEMKKYSYQINIP
jgi:hypothetical protein